MKTLTAWYAFLILIIVLVVYKNRATVERVLGGTVGIRNRNPLNIEYSASNQWLGQIGSDGRFAIFSDAEYGIRAGAKLLSRYINDYQLTSIYHIINRWAPPIDNNPTNNYAEFVAKRVGVNAYSDSVTDAHIAQIVTAMIEFENGSNPYPESIIRSGIQLAMG